MRRELGLALAALAALAAAAGSGAAAARSFRYERTVRLEASGPHGLPLDVPLLSGSVPFRVETLSGASGSTPLSVARGGLRDLRFYDAAGREVPYLLVEPRLPVPHWRRASAILSTPATKKESGFEADLGLAARVDRLRLSAIAPPFLKRLALDGSGDRRHWTRLVAEASLFDLPDSQLRQLEIGFPASVVRYLRVTWDDASSARVPPPREATARLAQEVSVRPAVSATLGFARRPSEPGTSRFRLRLPAPGLPVVALRLRVGGGHLLRPARVGEARLAGDGVVPVVLGETTLRRALRGALSAEELRIPLQPPTAVDLDLEVDDGDNTALELQGVDAELAALPWIYIEAERGTLTARWGDPDLEAPRYDLEAARERVTASAPPTAAWGTTLTPAAEDTAALGAPSGAGPAIETRPFLHVRALPAGPPGLVAVPLDAAVLAHSSGGLRGDFADLRVVDEAGRQLPYLLERRREPLLLAVSASAASGAAAGLDPGTSVYRLKLPFAKLPPARLVLRTRARVFERQVRVLVEWPDRRERPERRRLAETVASTSWRHIDPETEAPALTLGLPTLERALILLAVSEGDNTPLPIGDVELLLPSFQIRLFRTAGPLRVFYGHDRLARPRYDLALLGPSVLARPALEVALAAEQEARRAEPSILGRPLFFGLMLVSVLVLLLLIARLLRRPDPSSPV